MPDQLTCSKCGKSCGGDHPIRSQCPSCGAPMGNTTSEESTPATLPYVPSQDASLPVLPLEIPGFSIQEMIGRGGMGLVYRARQLNLNREVALKVMPPMMAVHKANLERFRHEASVAAALTNSQILPVYDILDVDGVPVLVLPFIAGQNLRQIIEEHWLNCAAASNPSKRTADLHYLRKILPLLDQLVEAVAVLHQADILHRDIKPSNLLVDAQGHLWLADFGLARLGTDSSDVSGVVGTRGYMSPEQVAGTADVDARADLFSVGVTFYRALTGKLPFGSKRIFESEPLPAPPSRYQPSLSRDVDAVVLKALEPVRGRRYASTRELADDWRRARQGLLPKARSVSFLYRCGRWLDRRRWQALGVMLAGMLLAVLAAVSFYEPPALPPENLRKVALTTEPQGAQVALVPIDEYGDLQEKEVIRPGQKTPLVMEKVPAGNYLVVVNVPGHGFHEVRRLVPNKYQGGGSYRHDRWRQLGDGTVELTTVVIPPQELVQKDLVHIPGGKFIMGRDFRGGISLERTLSSPAHDRAVASFYLDRTEVTVGQFEKVRSLPLELKNDASLPDFKNYPVTFISFPKALETAEMMGKRLPTETEYEFAATDAGRRDYPWGDDAGKLEDISWGPAPVGTPAFDRSPAGVQGLYSNIAEWTESLGVRYTPALHPSILRFKTGGEDYFKQFLNNRVARGGPSWMFHPNSPREPLLGPRSRAFLDQNQANPSLGFRCARSEKPRFLEP
jgi:formylglycine-generating enzyme required for sulfatase activity